jgi:hypothetical protein
MHACEIRPGKRLFTGSAATGDTFGIWENPHCVKHVQDETPIFVGDE